MVHPPVSKASFVPVTITEVPGEIPTGGEPTLGVKPVIFGAVVARAGTMRDETGINSAEVSSSNATNEELILAVANSTHALLNQRLRIN